MAAKCPPSRVFLGWKITRARNPATISNVLPNALRHHLNPLRGPPTTAAMGDDEESFSSLIGNSQQNITRISRNVAYVASAVINNPGDGVSIANPTQYHRAMTDILGYKRRIVASQIRDQTPRQALQQSLVRRLGGGSRAPLLSPEMLEDVPESRTQHSLYQTFAVTSPPSAGPSSEAARMDSEFALSVRKEMAASELLEIDERISELRAMRKLVFDRMADVEREQTSDERTLQHYYPRGERIKQFHPTSPHSANSSNNQGNGNNKPAIECVDFNSPFGQLALAVGDEVCLYELSSDQTTQLRGTVGHHINCLSVHGADPVVTCGAQHKVYVWHPPSGASQEDLSEPAELTGHVGDVIVVDNDGETLVTSSMDCTVREWDEKLGKCSTTIDMFPFGECRALQHSGSALATGTNDGIVRLFDLRQPVSNHSGRPNVARELLGGHTRAVTALSFQGLEMVSGSEDGSLRIWDLRNGEIGLAESYGGPIQSVQFDTSKVVASVAGENGVRVLSRPTGEHRISAIEESLVTSAKYMKGYLVTGRENGDVGVWAV